MSQHKPAFFISLAPPTLLAVLVAAVFSRPNSASSPPLSDLASAAAVHYGHTY